MGQTKTGKSGTEERGTATQNTSHFNELRADGIAGQGQGMDGGEGRLRLATHAPKPIKSIKMRKCRQEWGKATAKRQFAARVGAFSGHYRNAPHATCHCLHRLGATSN